MSNKLSLPSWSAVRPLKSWSWLCSFCFLSSEQNYMFLVYLDVYIFHWSRHTMSSLTSTTGLVSSFKVAMKVFPLLRKINARNYLLRFLRLISGSPRMSWKIFFQYGVFSFFKARYLQNYQFSVFVQNRNLMPATSVWKLVWKIVNFLPSLWKLDVPEMPKRVFSLETTRYSNFYFFNSTHFIFINQIVNLDSFIPWADCLFLVTQILISKSELESWEARSGKNDFSTDRSRNSNLSFSRTTDVNSCIRFWIDAFLLTLQRDSYTDESLVLFCKVDWIFASRFASPTFFSRIFVSFLKSIVVCSVHHLLAVLTETIAVRWHFLLSISLCTSVSKEALIVFILAQFSSSISPYMSLTLFVVEAASLNISSFVSPTYFVFRCKKFFSDRTKTRLYFFFSLTNFPYFVFYLSQLHQVI